MATPAQQYEILGATSKVVSETQTLKIGEGKLQKIITTATNAGTLKVIDGTESSAVATGVLTSAGACAPADYATQTITSSGACAPADYATQTLTSSGACAPAAHAKQTLTSNGTNVSDGDTVTINTTVYRFKKTPVQAYDVRIGSTAAESLANLKAAINLSGTMGVEYCVGTAAHTTVIATTLTATTLAVVARTIGTTANSYETTETSSTLSWGAATMAGGVATTAATVTINTTVYTAVKELSESFGLTAVANQVLWKTSEAVFLDNLKKAINGTGTAGSEYSTGTVAHTTVIATTNTDTTQVIRARTIGTAANSYATTTTLANYAWGDTTMQDGVATTAATITIGATVYTAVLTLPESIGLTPVPNYILWKTSEAVFLDNLKKAINGTGTAGTDYSAGTAAHADVVATDNGDTTQVIRAKTIGTAANAIATTTTLANYAWGDTTMQDGVATTAATITIGDTVYTAVLTLAETLGLTPIPYQVLWVTDEATFLDNLKSAINGAGTEGTTYGTGTLPHPKVIATTNAADSKTIQSRLTGIAQNSIATTTTLANYSWGETTLENGTGATGKILLDTYTPTAGDEIDFGDLQFDAGLCVVVGGTSIAATFVYK
jgi:hypothetical protein